jgi:hypothetical protein
MRPELVPYKDLVEFFKGLVDRAVTHQHLQALDLTRYYLVQLLAGRARAEAAADAMEPLALWLARAIESSGLRQRAELRELADHALFTSGFFSDSLARHVVDVDYYASVGGYAYQHLGASECDTLAPAYAELGRRFHAFADVLTEVSEQSALTSDSNLLRLYERWVRHGSRRNGERLLRQGIAPTLDAVRASTRLQ